MLPKTVDITGITGQEVAGPPTSWQTQNGPFNVEHLAAVNANNEVLVFWWSPQHNWQFVNISAKTGQKIVGGLTNWQTHSGPFLVENLAGHTSSGDLIVFWWSPQHDWQAVNVSAKTGKRVATTATSWVTPDGVGGTVEHLAARGVARELLVFYRTPARGWRVVDVTAKTGKTVSGEATSWIAHDGALLVEHLAGPAPDGSLVIFWWSPAHDWQAIDASAIAGGMVNGRPVSWMTGNVEHIAVRGNDNKLLVYWWTPATNWRRVDVTAITGVQIAEVGAVYQLADAGENVEVLTARGLDGALLHFWWKPSRDWQALNLSYATGALWASDSTAWVTPSGNRLIEHVAAATPQNHLLLAWDDGETRRLTDAVGGPFQLMKRQHGRRRIVAILWDPHRPAHPAPAAAVVDDLIFGPANSVRDYFLENSGGRFTIERAGVLGWFSASRPWDYWWGPADTSDADGDGWVSPHVQKWAEAVRLADPQFNYNVYDTNPFDGNLRPEELGVLIVIPQNSPFGTNRGAVGREYPNPQPLVVDGVTIGTIAEVYIGNPPNLGVVAHELAHLLLHHGDMYFTFFNPYAAGYYSLMDGTYKTTHIDPFAKLKFGWLRPYLIVRSGHYTLPSIEAERFVWILMDPSRGPDEYFIVENRWGGTSYDNQMPDAGGLAVWHIMESPAVFGSVPPPPGVTPQQWSMVGAGDGTRRAIRMLRPLVVPPFNDAIALRDGADPATGFDMLSEDPDPQHSCLKWADGTASGFTIRNISPAGPTMTADIHVPW
jgi:M6 family metalloprotease-like protein